MKTIVICSGGLDSVSLAHMVAQQHELTRLVSFDYGQRHRKELDYAALCAQRLAVPHDIIDLRAIGAALTGSALTDDIDVPEGHYAEESMRITVVPNRNAHHVNGRLWRRRRAGRRRGGDGGARGRSFHLSRLSSGLYRSL